MALPPMMNRHGLAALAQTAQNAPARSPAAESNVYFHQGIGIDPQQRRMYLFRNLPQGTYTIRLAEPVFGRVLVRPKQGASMDLDPKGGMPSFFLSAEEGRELLVTMPAFSVVEPRFIRLRGK